ncbi:MAG: hypothetical protein ACYTFM_10940 [Planctomycetota bacterium]|jgi:hypothetical protein
MMEEWSVRRVKRRFRVTGAQIFGFWNDDFGFHPYNLSIFFLPPDFCFLPPDF